MPLPMLCCGHGCLHHTHRISQLAPWFDYTYNIIFNLILWPSFSWPGSTFFSHLKNLSVVRLSKTRVIWNNACLTTLKTGLKNLFFWITIGLCDYYVCVLDWFGKAYRTCIEVNLNLIVQLQPFNLSAFTIPPHPSLSHLPHGAALVHHLADTLGVQLQWKLWHSAGRVDTQIVGEHKGERCQYHTQVWAPILWTTHYQSHRKEGHGTRAQWYKEADVGLSHLLQTLPKQGLYHL